MWHLIRLTFWRRRGKQQRAVDCRLQTVGGLHISPQIGNDHLLIYDSPVSANIGSVGVQGDVHNSIQKTKSGGNLVKDEGCMRHIVDRDGVRFGFVCHDGSCQFWEWNGAEGCPMPFMPSIQERWATLIKGLLA